MARSCFVLVLPLALALTLPSTARADDAAPGAQPESKAFEYSPYERETIRMVTEKLGAAVDPSPEGKTIESFDTERLDVFEKRDFLPNFLLFVNALHATTRPRIILREMLQHVGDRYSQLAIDETARNLRGLVPLSLVIVVPLRGSAPDRVRVLVITKDVWSLRLQWDIQLTNGGLQRLVLQPAETNLAGLHQTVGVNFLYQPLSTALGSYYYVPRLFGTRIALTASANAIFNNVTGSPEGSFGAIAAAQPLWSTRTEWAWGANAQWRNEVTRVYSNAQLATFGTEARSPIFGGDATGVRTVARSEQRNIPYEYQSHIAQAAVSVARSFGWAYKNDFTLSAEATHRQFRTDDLSGYDPAEAAQFVQTRVPVSDDRAYPALEWRSYTTNFLRVLDLETLGLQEDVRLGHWVDVKLYPVLKALGSSRDFFGLYAEAGYTVPMRDGVARLDVATTTETTFANVIQGVVDANAYVASPRTPIGRFVFSGRLLNRYANYLDIVSYLGADTRLRGYPSSYFAGKDMVAANLEYRSRALEILKVQVGGVLFYDAGEAFDGWSNFQPVHDVGFGLRALLPTFDRVVFRADVGFPISASPLPPGVGPVTFFVTFAQAFSLPQTGLKSSNAGALVQ